jgi:hypothetical protein
MTQKTNQNPWTMDVRVRERNLKSGALTDKDLDKFLTALPDVADQAEAFGTSQPALAQQHAVESSSADDGIDDDEDEDDGDDSDGDAEEGSSEPQGDSEGEQP